MTLDLPQGQDSDVMFFLYLWLSLWEIRGDAHFMDENVESPRGAGVQIGPFTGQDTTFSLVCLNLARCALPRSYTQSKNKMC